MKAKQCAIEMRQNALEVIEISKERCNGILQGVVGTKLELTEIMRVNMKTLIIMALLIICMSLFINLNIQISALKAQN